ncbi:MAG: tRNA lysidine(34) synthetase TilS [Pseudomonadota bacterium]
MSPADALAQALESALSDVSKVRLGVAVSGGGDSMALLTLLADWSQNRGITLEAASVDHGLRPEAKQEIALVAGQAKDLGVAHACLSDPAWQMQGNLQAAARDLRYALLRKWAAQRGLTHICLGHTLEDQAETVLLRLARGSGVDGLAGMSLLRRDPNAPLVWLRPLLRVHRSVLRDELTVRGVAWADDPSNDDARFDRVRARRLLDGLSDLGLNSETLSDTAARMAAARSALGQQSILAATQIARQEVGEVQFDKEKLFALPDDTAWRLFAAALCWVSGNSYRPRFSALRSALKDLADGRRVTLHGCLCHCRKSVLHVGREPAAVAPPVPVPGLWDNRWRVAKPPEPGLLIGALGEVGLSERPDWREAGLPRETLLVSPALWQGPRLYAAPLIDKALECQANFIRSNSEFNALLLPD